MAERVAAAWPPRWASPGLPEGYDFAAAIRRLTLSQEDAMSRFVPLAARACAALAVLLLLPAAGAQAKSRTISFLALVQSAKVVQGTTPMETFKDKLVNSAGHKLGSDTRSCTGLLTDAAGQQCMTSFKLKGGTISALLVFHGLKGAGKGSIKSGTGKYSKAKGKITYAHANIGTVVNERYSVTIKLT